MIKKLILPIIVLFILIINITKATESIELIKINQIEQEINSLKASINHDTNFTTKTLRQCIFDDNNIEHTYLEGLSSSTRALSLLKVRNKFGNNTLVLGGEIETDTQIWWSDKINAKDQNNRDVTLENGSGTYLTGAYLDLLYNLGQWLQIYFETITYQDDSSIETAPLSALVTLGNLDKSPIFLTVGKGRPMFGTFPGAPWAASIEQGLFRPGYVNNITLGYNEGNFITNFTYISPSANHSTFLIDSFYSYNIPETQLTFGGNVGYANDINGTGMYITDTPNSDTKRTPLLNVEGNAIWRAFTLYSGWASTLTNNPSFNNHGLSGVWYIQGAYNQNIFKKPTTFSLAFAQSYNMSNVYFLGASNAGNPTYLIGPHQQFYAFISQSFTKALTLSLEYAWMQTYNNKENNTVTFDTSIYF